MVPTLLEMINSCLIDIGRPSVERVGGSVDAQKVEQIYKQIYLSLVARKLWPFRKEVLALESLSDTDRPVVMKIPDNVERVEVVMYGYGDSMKELCYVEPEQFLTSHQASGANRVEIKVSSSGRIFAGTDGAPTSWTSFDDKEIVFNSYDSKKEDTLNEKNCMVVGFVIPRWPTDAEEYVDIPIRHFAMYDALARAACHEKIRKEPSSVDSYWGSSLYGRLLHESRTAGTQKGARTKYGRR